MSSNIVLSDLPENIAKEFSVDANGNGFASRRVIAKFSGVYLNSIQALLTKIANDQGSLPLMLQPFSGLKFEPDQRIPDTLASAIIKYYAYQGRETAQATDMALGAIGLRTVIQKALNYQPIAKRTLSQAEIIELCVLPVPSDWQRRFPEEYYTQLSRLTDLKQFGASRPSIWAKHTKELVYDWLPTGIYDAVKRCKTETDSYEKLHQFLSSDGLTILENHQRQLLTLMTASSSMEQLKTLLSQSCSGNYQLLLLSR
jgi:hypothetical protein